MKKEFESPKAEILDFEMEDIMTLTTSSFTPGENEGPFVPAL